MFNRYKVDTMKKATIIIFIVAVVALIGVLIGYRMWTKPHVKVEDVQGVNVTTEQLAGAYASDETTANKTYLNKAIVVSGTVQEVDRNQDGKALLVLDNDIQCTMRDISSEAKVGDHVKVKGFCNGNNLFGVVISDCVIIEYK